jgi:cyanuric acid amidohydrolase
MQEILVDTVTMDAPDDVTGIERLCARDDRDPRAIAAIIAQTEGDGHARGYSALSLRRCLARLRGDSEARIAGDVPMLMIGGVAGLMSPHFTVFSRVPGAPREGDGGPALAVGIAQSPDISQDRLGGMDEVEAALEAVRAAMADAGIDDPGDVVCVELKCPQGADPAHGASSRGACALGAALALEEIAEGRVSAAAIGKDRSLYSERASASSGSELSNIKAIVIGNRVGAPGCLRAGGGVMTDALDVAGAQAAFRAAGLPVVDGCVPAEEARRIRAVFVNAGADGAPSCRGHRHTMGGDLLPAHAGHLAKAVAHAQVAAIAGTPLVLGNAGWEHQGPPGGNLVCVIAERAGAGIA